MPSPNKVRMKLFPISGIRSKRSISDATDEGGSNLLRYSRVSATFVEIGHAIRSNGRLHGRDPTREEWEIQIGSSINISRIVGRGCKERHKGVINMELVAPSLLNFLTTLPIKEIGGKNTNYETNGRKMHRLSKKRGHYAMKQSVRACWTDERQTYLHSTQRE